ncbi:hypothetical protein DYB26_013536 [Aphanomyces astaci]|uniref:Uncharacterized protein n=1 Tax=Aphanomyces astaci TaxID=112090 RepID=A0A418DIX3_APHAT|nr:hypothetical protein DYB26_013536 [Aphanomyces astaci]
MFRQPQSGNWADACDEDDERLTVPQQHASVPSTTNAPSSSRTDEYPSRPVVPAAPAKAPAASNYWVTRGQQAAAPAPRADTSNFRRGDDHPSSRGASYDRRDERGDYQDRRRDYDDRGGRRNYDSQDSGRFGRQDNNGRGYDRQDSNSSYGARGGGYGRDHQDSQRPAPSGRWGQAANAPRHEGFVTNFREDGGFGFLHCLELKQDVFFHESEVPARATDASTSAQQPSDTSSTLLSHISMHPTAACRHDHSVKAETPPLKEEADHMPLAAAADEADVTRAIESLADEGDVQALHLILVYRVLKDQYGRVELDHGTNVMTIETPGGVKAQVRYFGPKQERISCENSAFNDKLHDTLAKLDQALQPIEPADL